MGCDDGCAWAGDLGHHRQTADGGLLVFLKVVVYEAEDERGLCCCSVRCGLARPKLWYCRTFPTAASPSRTSLMLLVGLGALGSAMVGCRSRSGLNVVEFSLMDDAIEGGYEQDEC